MSCSTKGLISRIAPITVWWPSKEAQTVPNTMEQLATVNSKQLSKAAIKCILPLLIIDSCIRSDGDTITWYVGTCMQDT